MRKPRLSIAVEWLGRHEFVVLLAALVVVAGVWGFIALADVVLEGRTQSLDESMLLALRQPNNPAMPIGPEWMAEVGRDFTAVGGVAVLLLVTLAVAGFLLLDRKFAAMGFVLGAVASEIISSHLP
jgi:undecaprenyl-diphosphatase